MLGKVLNMMKYTLMAVGLLAVSLSSLACSSDKQNASAVKNNLTKSLAKGLTKGGQGSGDVSSQLGGISDSLSTGACDSSTSTSGQTTCTDAEVEAFGNTIISGCDSQFKAAFGNDWLSGTYGGQCGDFMNCYAACDPCDQKCTDECAKKVIDIDKVTQLAQTGDEAGLNAYLMTGCMGAMIPVGTCVEQYIDDAPACLNESGSSSSSTSTETTTGANCSALAACCTSLPSTEQSTCDGIVSAYKNQGSTGETACSQAVTGYQGAGFCVAR